MPGAESAATIVLSSGAAADAIRSVRAAANAAGTPAGTVPAPITAPSALGKYVGLAAAAAIVIGLLVWVFGRGTTSVKPVVVPPPGSVVLEIAPWANIEAITAKADGKPASGGCSVTPCVITLPAGEYHVRASNPNFPGSIEFDVVVDARGVRNVRQAIPGFKPEDEVSKILDK